MPALVLTLLAAPVHAQQEEEEGLNLMEEGAKLFFRGLMSEMEPALRELDRAAREMEPHIREFAQVMGPALADLMDQVDDWTVYEAPEILPNGDIIMRRKEPLEPDETPESQEAPEAEAGPEIEL